TRSSRTRSRPASCSPASRIRSASAWSSATTSAEARAPHERAKMARPRAADYDAQRDRIPGRAVQAFAETGWPSASMAALADACGTSKAGLYHYYPSKEAILFDSLDRYTDRLAAIVQSTHARGLAPRDEVRALVRAFLAEYRHSRAYHVALLNDVKFLDEPLRERIRAREREIVEAFADALERGWPAR